MRRRVTALRVTALGVAAAMAVAPIVRASDINDDVILGALVAEFHISVAASLLPDATPETVPDAATSERWMPS